MTVCDTNKCAGCMLCLDVCSKNAIHIEDKLDAYNAYIDEEKCIGCNACHNKCPQNAVPSKTKPIAWYQGWNKNAEVREEAPSGGIGLALANSFAQNGGYVCSCLFKDGVFCFDITNDPDQIVKFGGSKYVKSNPRGIYPRILDVLKEGNKVLFIGLPCQVAAVKNYVGDRYEDSLYLVDLICHGTPSPRLLEMFLNQYNKGLHSIKNIAFRIKAKMQIVADGEGIVCKGVSDKYTIGFLNGLTYTDNCYSCQYASLDRVSDITIGDSWGSGLENERKKGISLMLIQTNKGRELISRSDIDLHEVDLINAINNNDQLSHPMEVPKQRRSFFADISRWRFNRLILLSYWNQCIKQDLKLILIKMRIVK